ncbi:MAG: DUF3368 domain-containing protein [Caldilineaceae bacterium]
MPDIERIVISNTTPIITLAVLQRLDLLQHLYGEIWIPPAVKAELLPGGTRAGANEIQSASYIQTVPLAEPDRADLLSDLDRGEEEVIVLALERQADLVIIDERLGRRHAQRLGLSVTGALGVLLRAKEQGYVQSIESEIVRLRQAGIRISDPLVERVLQLAGER